MTSLWYIGVGFKQGLKKTFLSTKEKFWLGKAVEDEKLLQGKRTEYVIFQI